jgi:hypothetical protein
MFPTAGAKALASGNHSAPGKGFFDKDGKANKYLYMYDEISKEYLK